MGKIRARTKEELIVRKQEILDAASAQLMDEGYEAVTLATISSRTSISRTSMYTYYAVKEDVFVDLMIHEYLELEKILKNTFSKRVTRECFCKKLTEVFMSRQVLLKLLSLQLTVRDGRYSDEMMQCFVNGAQSYATTLWEILRRQFPHATEGAINRFMMQFSLYSSTLYAAAHMPAGLASAMNSIESFGKGPDGNTLCYDGLMLLSAELE